MSAEVEQVAAGLEQVGWLCPNDPDAASAFRWHNAGSPPPRCPNCGAALRAVWAAAAPPEGKEK